jgi:hypothetical protein
VPSSSRRREALGYSGFSHWAALTVAAVRLGALALAVEGACADATLLAGLGGLAGGVLLTAVIAVAGLGGKLVGTSVAGTKAGG